MTARLTALSLAFFGVASINTSITGASVAHASVNRALNHTPTNRAPNPAPKKSPSADASPAAQRSADPRPGPASNPPNRHRFTAGVLTGLRFVPIGLGLRARLGYRYQLFTRDSRLFRDTYIWSHLVVDTAPTFALGGIEAFIQPLAVIRFGVHYLAGRYFASVGNVAAFASPADDHSDQNVKARAKAGLNYGANGQRLTLSTRLQGQIAAFVLRSELKAHYRSLGLLPPHRYFYDRINDTMVMNRGWTLQSDSDAFWNFRAKSYLGARLTVIRAYFAPGDKPSKETSIRLGPALVLALPALKKKLGTAPQFIFLSQWHLRHRYRTGRAQHQAIPTLTFALRGQWQWGRDARRR